MKYNRIVLTGFMGTGKTSVSKILAARLMWLFFDTDALAETTEGLSVSEIFDKKGEAHFRKLERRCLEGLVSMSEVVIATGGGTLLSDEALALIKEDSALICLWASEDELKRRLARSHSRPLLQNGFTAVANLLREREPLYRKMGLQVDTTGISPSEVCDKIIELIGDDINR